ncbi:MAG: ATP-binding protein [Bacteroidetes bacterium]|nr:ATP-binding protein [Bacteroidota bacterium]
MLDLDFVRRGGNIVLVGNPGTGTTIIAKILAFEACQRNFRVLFATAVDMLNQLLASQVDHSLVRKIKSHTDPALLVVDEPGYLALDQNSANLLYQVISAPHAFKRSTVITTNTAFFE